jgi:hypothetical protein
MKPDRLFMYTAAALRLPLAELVAHLDAGHAKIEPNLVEARKLVELKKTRVGHPVTDSELKASSLIQQAIANRRERLKAALWLRECRRIWGWRRFWLTPEELTWLYQGKELDTHG